VTEELKVLVLDAMGVIYSVRDDVKDLLCPFVAEKGGTKDTTTINELYRSASLGNMSAFEFWKAVNVSSELEDEYLSKHKLSDGLVDFLEETNQRGHEVWCLSNDLSEWSRKLRLHFRLEKYFNGFVISSDVGFRKPDPAIFHRLVTQSNMDPHKAIFIDDNKKNLDSAAILGFETVVFRPVASDSTGGTHKIVNNFNDILPLLT